MSHALRSGTEASYMPCRAERFIGDLTTVKCLHTVTGRVAEGNHFSGATLVRHGGWFPAAPRRRPFPAAPPVHRAPSRPRPPSRKNAPIGQAAIDNQALLSVVHAERTHVAAAINRLKPKLAGSKLVQSSSFEVPTQK
jgi:hypothetical protein